MIKCKALGIGGKALCQLSCFPTPWVEIFDTGNRTWTHDLTSQLHHLLSLGPVFKTPWFCFLFSFFFFFFFNLCKLRRLTFPILQDCHESQSYFVQNAWYPAGTQLYQVIITNESTQTKHVRVTYRALLVWLDGAVEKEGVKQGQSVHGVLAIRTEFNFTPQPQVAFLCDWPRHAQPLNTTTSPSPPAFDEGLT